MQIRILALFFIFFSCQNEQEHAESFDNNMPPVARDSPIGRSLDEITSNEDPDRKDWQNPSLVIKKLGDLEDKTVADIGAGTGYFSFRLAREGAKVIAIDIDPEFLQYINDRQEEVLPTPGNHVVETRLSNPDNPLLANGEADAVLLVNTYTYISDRTAYLGKVHTGMVSGGIIAIVDYKNDSIPVINEATPIIAPEKVAEELKQAGFYDVVIDEESLQYQYIITAKKK